jgi:hypothetical protein
MNSSNWAIWLISPNHTHLIHLCMPTSMNTQRICCLSSNNFKNLVQIVFRPKSSKYKILVILLGLKLIPTEAFLPNISSTTYLIYPCLPLLAITWNFKIKGLVYAYSFISNSISLNHLRSSQNPSSDYTSTLFPLWSNSTVALFPLCPLVFGKEEGWLWRGIWCMCAIYIPLSLSYLFHPASCSNPGPNLHPYLPTYYYSYSDPSCLLVLGKRKREEKTHACLGQTSLQNFAPNRTISYSQWVLSYLHTYTLHPAALPLRPCLVPSQGGRWHAIFLKRAPLPEITRHWPPLPLLKSSQARLQFVLFLSTSIARALRACTSSNTWRARVRRPLSEPTDFLLTYPLAIGLSPLPLTLWRRPISSPCPFLVVRPRRALRPDSGCHVVTVPRPPLDKMPPRASRSDQKHLP